MSALNKPDDHSLAHHAGQSDSTSSASPTPPSPAQLPTSIALLAQLDATLSQLGHQNTQDKKGLGASQSQFGSSNPNLQAQGSPQTGQGSGDATENMQLAMSKLGGAMSALQEILLQYQANTEGMQAKIGAVQISNAQAALNTAQQQYQQYEAEVAKQAEDSKIHKILGGLLALIGVVASCFMGPEMLVMTVAMTVLSLPVGPNGTSAMSDMLTGISKGLSSSGVLPPEAAKILSDVIVIAMVVAAALLTGNMSGAGDAATEIAGQEVTAGAGKAAEKVVGRATEEAAEDVAEDAGNASESGGQGSSPTSSTEVQVESTETESLVHDEAKISETFDKSVKDSRSSLDKLRKLFGKTKHSRFLAGMFGTMAGLQTGLPGDITIAAGGTQQQANIVNGVAALLAMVGMFVCGLKMGSGASTAEAFKNATKALPDSVASFANSVADMISTPQFQSYGKAILTSMQAAGLAMQATVSFYQYSSYMNMANITDVMSQEVAATDFYQTIDKMNASLNQQLVGSINSAITDVGQEIYAATASFNKEGEQLVSLLQQFMV